MEALDRMTDMMTHRGPNERGTYAADGIALGVRRLSIVDVEGGHQPVSSEDALIWAIQNGELYNHARVREELEPDGHVFRSNCDTEVIPHLYERRGTAFAQHLRGKFAIAVWDARRRRAVLARDRLGVKPLYFARVGELLLFASELKSLLASGLIEVDLDYEAIDAYLTFGFVPAPRTPLAGVSKLLPGHLLVVEEGSVRTEAYWEYPLPSPDSRPRPVDEYAADLLELLEESVRLRLMSDVPLGAMLSGGLDSSLIVALMARNTSEPVKTFSVGFHEDPASELADARSVAELFATEHHELELSFSNELDLEQLVWRLDEPLADLSSVGFLALSELAARHVTVALSGQGADELLGGYSRYRTAAMAESWRRIPSTLRRGPEYAAAHGTRRSKRAVRLLSSERGAARILTVWDGANTLDRIRDPNGPLGRRDVARTVVETKLGTFESGPLSELLYVDAQLGLVDDMLHYFDRASMAHSLEVRVPFLDHHLVEYCARIPTGLKVQRLTTKYVLKHAARTLLPDGIVNKKKVGFFHGSVQRWLSEQAGTIAPQYLFASAPRYTEFLRESEVRRLAMEQTTTRGYSVSQLLFKILILEVWLSVFLPSAAKRPVLPSSRL
jgi:asparagine synthase (glutamine-hydrolysing)